MCFFKFIISLRAGSPRASKVLATPMRQTDKEANSMPIETEFWVYVKPSSGSIWVQNIRFCYKTQSCTRTIHLSICSPNILKPSLSALQATLFQGVSPSNIHCHNTQGDLYKTRKSSYCNSLWSHFFGMVFIRDRIRLHDIVLFAQVPPDDVSNDTLWLDAGLCTAQ